MAFIVAALGGLFGGSKSSDNEPEESKFTIPVPPKPPVGSPYYTPATPPSAMAVPGMVTPPNSQ